MQLDCSFRILESAYDVFFSILKHWEKNLMRILETGMSFLDLPSFLSSFPPSLLPFQQQTPNLCFQSLASRFLLFHTELNIQHFMRKTIFLQPNTSKPSTLLHSELSPQHRFRPSERTNLSVIIFVKKINIVTFDEIN